MKVKFHRYVLYFLLRVFSFLLKLLPLDLCSAIGKKLGILCFYLLKHERKKAIAHLTVAFGNEKNPKEIKQIAKETFANLGRNAGEWLKMPALSNEQIIERVDVENFEVIEKVLAKGKGLILLTGHFGNWEWLAAFFGSLGYDGGVLAREIYFEPYNRFLVDMRLSHSIKTIYRDDSPKKILKLLADNGILGILPDQDVDKINGIFIPFFGKEALTPTAPVALARASGAMIVPGFLVRKKNRFKLFLEQPIEVPKTENKEDVLKFYTEKWNQILEKHITEHPDHWVWIHRRWKTKPGQ